MFHYKYLWLVVQTRDEGLVQWLLAAKINFFEYKRNSSRIKSGQLNIWVDYTGAPRNARKRTIIMGLESAVQFPGALFTAGALQRLILRFNYSPSLDAALPTCLRLL